MGIMNQRGINIFISSPGDVARERELLEEIISEISKSVRDTLGYHLECKRWEDQIPQASLPPKTKQDEIMKEIGKCQMFILILHKRYGEIPPKQKISRTEMEIELALKLLQKGKDIMFLSYFKKNIPNPDPGDQEKLILLLEEKLEKEKGVLSRKFKSLEDFKNKFTHDLYHALLIKSKAPTKKQEGWKNFWGLDTLEGKPNSRLAIICPAMDKRFANDNIENIWTERLMPFIPFEDFSAVEFIERTLRDINFTEFKTYPTARLPEEIMEINRVWICLPRNRPGVIQLENYKKGLSFMFASNTATNEKYFQWRFRKTKTFMDIKSPLAKYLMQQRRMIESPTWGPEHGKIIAKDFAILARFTDNNTSSDSGILKDFFFAGIRGLGTWGAGWFLFNKCEVFQKLVEPDEKNIQLLLEVTFKDEKIFDVKDVSNQPQSYFDNENNENVVYENIRKYKSGEI